MESGIKPPIYDSFKSYINNNDNRVVPETPLLNKNPAPIKITGEQLLHESSDLAEQLLHESPHLSDIQPSLKNPDLAAGQLLHGSPDLSDLHESPHLSDIQPSLNKNPDLTAGKLLHESPDLQPKAAGQLLNNESPDQPSLNKLAEQLLHQFPDMFNILPKPAKQLVNESPNLDVQPSLNKLSEQLLHQFPDMFNIQPKPAEQLFNESPNLSAIQPSLNKKQKILDSANLSDVQPSLNKKQKIMDSTELAEFEIRNKKLARLLHPHLPDIQPSLNENPHLPDIQPSLNEKQKIMDPAEPTDHHLLKRKEDLVQRELKRKEFQDLVQREPRNPDVRVKYAMWEQSQGDLDRARLIWKRAMRKEVFKLDHSMWEKYAQFEMRNNSLVRARSIWSRAVTLLPRVEQLRCKYALMEETIGEVAKARHVFDSWMTLKPDVGAWCAYIDFEVRHKEIERARRIFERFVQCHPKFSVWICYAGFEMKNGQTGRARTCYERAVDSLVDKANEEAEVLYKEFASFEEGNKEIERARAVYEFAIKRIPVQRAKDLYRRFLAFEKQHGSKESTEDVVVVRKRLEYEIEVGENPLNYESWFNYIVLEESFGNKERIREVYKRAIANVPPANEKPFWQRYIYLWISYALFEEMEEEDVLRTREVYNQCLKLIPQEKFSFSKLWVLAAAFEIRQLNLTGARQILETAILMAPRDKIFRTYIELELRLGNIKQCRTVYEKYLEWAPGRSYAWIQYAEMERSLGETERARAIFELAAAQSAALDMPNSLWKAYIGFQIDYGGFGRAKNLCESPADSKKKVEKRRRDEEANEYPDYIPLS